MLLGVRAVLAKSFARIHRANLINWGVAPLVFDDPAAYDGIARDDRLRLDGLRAALAAGEKVRVTNTRTGAAFTVSCTLTPRERDILLAGGLLAHTRSRGDRERSHAAPETAPGSPPSPHGGRSQDASGTAHPRPEPGAAPGADAGRSHAAPEAGHPRPEPGSDRSLQ
jgi:hypothetical protein